MAVCSIFKTKDTKRLTAPTLYIPLPPSVTLRASFGRRSSAARHIRAAIASLWRKIML